MTDQTSDRRFADDPIILGLGTNLGERMENLQRAVEAIAEYKDCSVVQVSNLYETPPWGNIDQPPFLNAALHVQTNLTPQALLDACLAIEEGMGRQRRERWGPRLIDIDILLFGDRSINRPNLKIPHPQITERVFALLPLVDVAPTIHISGRTATEWLERLDKGDVSRIAGPDWVK